MINKDLKGLVVYPREVVAGEDYEGFDDGGKHIKGVTNSGKEVTVYLTIPKKDQGTKSPLLSTEKENKRKKTTTVEPICGISDDNGPGDERQGALLFEQVTAVEGQEGVYEANWVSRLCIDENDYDFLAGTAYVELNFGKPSFGSAEVTEIDAQIKELKAGMAESESPMEDEDKINALEKRAIEDLKRYINSSIVFCKHNELVEVEADPDKIKSVFLDMMDRNTVDGMYGGVNLRVRKDDLVYTNLSGLTENYYLVKESSATLSETRYTAFQSRRLGYILSQAKRLGAVIELIPTQRVNIGMDARQSLNNYKSFLKIRNSFYDQEDFSKSLCRHVYARVVEAKSTTKDETSLVYTTAHTVSKAFGSPLELNSQFERKYKLVDSRNP